MQKPISKFNLSTHHSRSVAKEEEDFINFYIQYIWSLKAALKTSHLVVQYLDKNFQSLTETNSSMLTFSFSSSSLYILGRVKNPIRDERVKWIIMKIQTMWRGIKKVYFYGDVYEVIFTESGDHTLATVTANLSSFPLFLNAHHCNKAVKWYSSGLTVSEIAHVWSYLKIISSLC